MLLFRHSRKWPTHLDAVSGAVVSVRCWQVVDFRAVFFQERVGSKVGGIASGGQDNWPQGLVATPALLILDPNHDPNLVHEGLDVCLANDLGPIGRCLTDILELDHKSHRNGHLWVL